MSALLKSIYSHQIITNTQIIYNKLITLYLLIIKFKKIHYLYFNKYKIYIKYTPVLNYIVYLVVKLNLSNILLSLGI